MMSLRFGFRILLSLKFSKLIHFILPLILGILLLLLLAFLLLFITIFAKTRGITVVIGRRSPVTSVTGATPQASRALSTRRPNETASLSAGTVIPRLSASSLLARLALVASRGSFYTEIHFIFREMKQRWMEKITQI